MAEDWFRSQAWDEAAIEDFETRLARSRPHNRHQYLRIKAHALAGVGRLDDALVLLQRVLDEYPESLSFNSALEMGADILRQQGDLDGAIARYRQLLTTDLNATTGEAGIRLAEALLDKWGAEAAEEARELLNETRITWNSTLFRALLVSSRAAEALGDRDLQMSEARRALDLLSAAPQLSHKPDIGVARPSAEELEQATHLAKG